MKKNSGFTLIEVLTVSGIMALFAITLISILLATLRGGTKAQVVQLVRQNGDFAMEAMARMVRNAKLVDCSGGVSLITTNPDGNTSIFARVDDGGVNRIASTSGSSQFLTGPDVETSAISFSCYQGVLGNQVVTMVFTLATGQETGAQAQEQLVQSFSTSVATRQY